MLKYHENEDGHFIELVIDGKITKDELDGVWARIHERFNDWGEVKVLKELKAFGGIEPSAISANFKYGLANFKKFGRTAIVTDKVWAKHLSNLANRLIRQEVKVFPLNQRENARKWLSEAT